MTLTGTRVHAHDRRPTVAIRDVEPRTGRLHAFGDDLRFRDDNLRKSQRRPEHGNRDDPAERRVLDAHAVELAVIAQSQPLDAILESRDFAPSAMRTAPGVRDLAAVAVADNCQQLSAVAAALELALRASGKFFPDHIP